MDILQPLHVWMNFNKLSTHYEVSIGFLKYVNTGLTLHSTTKKQVINALMNVKLLDSDITKLWEYSNNDDIKKSSNKRTSDSTQKHRWDNDNFIDFLTFDLSTKRIGFVNESARVTTIAYAIRYHPHHTTWLKSIIIQASLLDPTPPSDSHIHFILHGLI